MGRRVGLFVDVQNMYYSAKNVLKGKLNYAKLLEIAKVQGDDLCIARAYILTKREVKTGAFETMLEKNGYDVRRKYMEFRGKEGEESNSVSWEIGMTVDIIEWARKLDKIILLTGNGAFGELLDFLKRFVSVEVMFFKDSTNSYLIRNADRFIDLGEYRNHGILLAEDKVEEKVESKKLDLDGEDDVDKVNAHVEKAATKNGMGMFG